MDENNQNEEQQIEIDSINDNIPPPIQDSQQQEVSKQNNNENQGLSNLNNTNNNKDNNGEDNNIQQEEDPINTPKDNQIISNNGNIEQNEKNHYMNQNEKEENNGENENNENNVNIINSQDIDEEYMKELYSKLAKMRQDRKDAQNDAKLLDNRLNLLKKEEKKALKKVENTKFQKNNKLLRLQEIVENKRIIDEAKKYKEREIEIKKKRNKKMNDEIKKNTEKNKAIFNRQKNEEAKLIKMQKEYNKQMTDYLKKENFKENKAKYNCLKSQKNCNDEKKRIINKEKRIMLKQELEIQLLEEYRLKQEAEAKKNKAEQEEMEIIKKLQNTTQIHKNIMEEMEKLNINSVMKGDYGSLNENNNINNNANIK